MLGYFTRRILYALLAVWAVSVISFMIITLPPGDYVTSYIATLTLQGNIVLQDEADNLREFYGINRPLYIQYLKWMNQIVTGNLGFSFEFGLPVTDVIAERLYLTILLALTTVIFIWVIAIPIGILSAVKQYSLWDHTFTFFGFIGLAVPDFLIALILMYLAFIFFDFSIGGLFSPEFVTAPWSLPRIIDLLKHMIIPVVILGTAGTASLIRITRANLLDELRKPYVVTARAKGLSEWKLILKYPVKIALNPAVSLTAYILPFLVSGSIVVSVVLGLPTVGPILLKALVAQDMYLAGSIILLIGWMTVVGTFISDLLLAWVDPRVRFGD
ncbi:MAG: ABC transporter permease [Chloroflexota bacterium]|uniref:ABC transmembrane type-1 domain-containing protein n=1 Tax=marine metagenome TaxID=408172 RepID=A0A381VQW7_9ZZZZ|nr:ABC transporter permease [Chloroflexota bacterium]